jgi:hypothetical protein
MEEILDENEANSDTGLVISEKSKTVLAEAVKWSRFMAIMGFIGLGLMLIGALVVISMPSKGFGNSQFGSSLGLMYLVMAVIYFFPLYYLYNFSDKMRKGLRETSQLSLDEAFVFLKKHYKYIAILTIVIMSIYILAIIIGIVTAGMMR